jgi:hypothetical protein
MAIISLCFVLTQVWLSLTCLQRKNLQWFCTLNTVSETIYLDLYILWIRPQWLGLNLKVKATSSLSVSLHLFRCFLNLKINKLFYQIINFSIKNSFIVADFIAFLFCFVLFLNCETKGLKHLKKKLKSSSE